MTLSCCNLQKKQNIGEVHYLMETEPRPKRRPECLSAFDLIFGLLFLIEVVLTSGARIVEITYLLYI